MPKRSTSWFSSILNLSSSAAYLCGLRHAKRQTIDQYEHTADEELNWPYVVDTSDSITVGLRRYMELQAN